MEPGTRRSGGGNDAEGRSGDHAVSQIVVALVYAVGALLMVPCVVLLAECAAGALPARGTRARAGRRPRIAVVIPAHDEEVLLASTIGEVKPQLRENDRVLVVADNCSDGTADVARRAGADVVERFDSERRGKGYALARAVDALRADPPEIVVILDADMKIGEGSLDALGDLVAATGRPAQSLDLLDPPADPTDKDVISALAFTLHSHRPRGLARLGMPCHLMGTGVALPWSSVRDARLATGNLVEDLQLGIDLAIRGQTATFCSGAKVTGRLPKASAAALAQRTRWEHGHLQTMATQAPRLLAESLRQRRLDLLALALDLLVPPLSLLVLLLFSTGLVAVAVGGLTGTWGPSILPACSLLIVVAAVLVGWWTSARKTVPFRALVGIPVYLVWKLPLYLRFIFRRQKRWDRSSREPSA